MSASSLVRDRQQATALAVLRRAQGTEVTYDELREAGIQFPATAMSELELSGVPVERSHWLQGVSWRLDPHRDAVLTPAPPTQEEEALPAAEAAPQWGQINVYGRHPAPSIAPRRPRAPRRDRGSRIPEMSRARGLSALALLAAAVTVAVLALNSLTGGAPAHRVASHRVARPARTQAVGHPPRRQPAPSHSSSTSRPSTRQSVGQSAPSPTSPSALEARGHSLLQSGQYATAIPVLRQAVQATGEHPGACTQPTDPNCLTYAFALYDLGRALRLDGNPAAAVPILKLRLGINNQRDAVAQELQLAQASATPTSPSALEARGHSLLQSGQYATAIPVLRQAVQATGEHPGACTQPTDPNCLTYAFALYDLGRALRLDGNPAAAVPILKLRLGINNQRDAVAQELQLAQSGAAG